MPDLFGRPLPGEPGYGLGQNTISPQPPIGGNAVPTFGPAAGMDPTMVPAPRPPTSIMDFSPNPFASTAQPPLSRYQRVEAQLEDNPPPGEQYPPGAGALSPPPAPPLAATDAVGTLGAVGALSAPPPAPPAAPPGASVAPPAPTPAAPPPAPLAAPPVAPAAPPPAPAPPGPPAAGGDFLDRLGGMENATGNPAARNPRSSATGNFQFIDGTWREYARANPDRFQGMNDEQVLARRADPDESRRAAAWYAQENAKALSAQGLPAGSGELGLAHRFGPQGASAALRADPNAPAASVFGEDVMRANPDLAGKTVGQVVGDYRGRFGGTTMTAGAAPSGGVAARTGGTDFAGPGVPQEAPAASQAAPQADPMADFPSGAPTREPTRPLIDPQWAALASGFFGGKNIGDSLARGTAALGDQQNIEARRNDNDRASRQELAVRRAGFKVQQQHNAAQIAQSDRQFGLQSRTADLAERRTRVLEDAQRLSGAGGNHADWQDRGTFANAAGETSTVDYNRRSGTYRVNGQEVPAGDFSKLGLVPASQSATLAGGVAGARATAGVDAKEAGEYREEIFGQATSARAMQSAIRDMREVIKSNPTLTGDSLRSRLARSAATALGIPVDDKDPAALSMLSNLMATGERNQIAQMAPLLRPLSNTDIPTALRGVFSMADNPRNVEARLAEAERESTRMEERAQAYRAFAATPDAARRSHRSWGDQWDVEYRGRGHQGPNIEPGPDGGWRASASALGVPTDPAQRVVGKTYQSPRGPMRWTAEGWVPAQ